MASLGILEAEDCQVSKGPQVFWGGKGPKVTRVTGEIEGPLWRGLKVYLDHQVSQVSLVNQHMAVMVVTA